MSLAGACRSDYSGACGAGSAVCSSCHQCSTSVLGVAEIGRDRDAPFMLNATRAAAALALFAGGLASLDPLSLAARDVQQPDEWHHYTNDVGGTKYSPLAQITKDNVRQLRVAWRWPSADRAIQESDPLLRTPRNEETPLLVNGTLYRHWFGIGRGTRSGDRSHALGLRSRRLQGRPAGERRLSSAGS